MVIYIRPNRRAYRTKRIVLRFSTLDSHYQDLRAETLRVIQGTSRLNVDLLNSIVEETTAQIKELEQQIETANAKLQELVSGTEKARQDYAEVMNWAKLFDNCNFEAKKMIIAQFVKAVRVKRDYEIEVESNVAFDEFQQIYSGAGKRGGENERHENDSCPCRKSGAGGSTACPVLEN